MGDLFRKSLPIPSRGFPISPCFSVVVSRFQVFDPIEDDFCAR
jgi:hypothetical protein